MKIAVASDDGKVISQHFGRTKGFSIYEVDGGRIKGSNYLLNTFTGHAMGGGNGHQQGHRHQEGHAQKHGPILVALKDVSVVISHGMGMRIYNDLKAAGKEVIVTNETRVEKAVQLYLENNLTDHPEKGCEH